MKSNASWGAMLRTFLDSNAVFGIPILTILWIVRKTILPMMPGRERHIPLTAIVIFGIVRQHAHFSENLCYHGILRNCFERWDGKNGQNRDSAKKNWD
jgi:hypothetical protein